MGEKGRVRNQPGERRRCHPMIRSQSGAACRMWLRNLVENLNRADTVGKESGGRVGVISGVTEDASASAADSCADSFQVEPVSMARSA